MRRQDTNHRHHLRILSPHEEEEGRVRSVFFLVIKLLLAVSCLALIGYGVIRLRDDVISNYDYFRLDEVTFSGDGQIDESVAMALIECEEKEYLLNFSTKKAEEKLLALADVVSAEVSVVLPRELVIKIHEHQPMAQLVDERGELIQLLDKEGALYEVTERQWPLVKKLPKVVSSNFLNLKAEVSPERVQAIKVLVALHERALKPRLKQLTMVNEYSFQLTYLHQGLEVKAVFPFSGYETAVDHFVEVLNLSHRQLKLKEVILLGAEDTIISVY